MANDGGGDDARAIGDWTSREWRLDVARMARMRGIHTSGNYANANSREARARERPGEGARTDQRAVARSHRRARIDYLDYFTSIERDDRENVARTAGRF